MSARRRRILLPGRGFDPEWPLHNLPDLAAWYTFDDADYLFTDAGSTNVTADGDKIYQCNDRSGNGRHVIQGTEADRPLWKTNIRANRAVGRFNPDASEEDKLVDASPGALLRDVAGATLIAVYVATNSPENSWICRVVADNLDNGDATRGALKYDLTGNGSLVFGGSRLDTEAIERVESGNGILTNNIWGVHSARVDYTAQTVRLYYQSELVKTEASFQSAGHTNDTDGTYLSIGGNYTGGSGLEGDLAEVIICGADIGYPRLKALWQRYLGPKWHLPI